MKGICMVIFLFLINILIAQKQAAQKETIKFLTQTEDAIVKLAKEIPDNKYDWRPNESVRNIGEIILHTAASNYYILMNLGISPPEDINLLNMESIQGKEKIIQTLSASFNFVFDHLISIKDKELNKKVKFPFAEMTKHGALLLLVDHNGEHKGQLIAYARSIGVAPPWSK